jgi:uncharacterized protein (TIGR02996 family)
MTPDEQAHLKAIAANLNEDVPQLMFAEWLDETADEIVGSTPEKISMKDRAEFIRIQISLARKSDIVGGKPWTTKLAEKLTARERKLLDVHQADWEASIRQALPYSSPVIAFHRGFPRDVSVIGVRELIASGILDSDTNTLTGLMVNNLGDQLPQLLSHPGIVRLTSLDLGDNFIGVAGAEALANSPDLANLTQLNLRNNNIGSIGVEALVADSSHLKKLTILDLCGNRIGDAGAMHIAHSSNLPSLTTLNLADNNISLAGATILIGGALPLPATVSALRSIGCNPLADRLERNARRPSGGDANPHEPPAKWWAGMEGLSDAMDPNPGKPTRKGFVR